tara:strand:+ start:1764 stop:2003 length:240 start_codon:yes stop_codon:yes gene_type:complete
MDELKTTTKRRFTTLIDDDLLSQIKLISYFTNQKLNETINNSLLTYIKEFETKNNTKISDIMNFQNNFKEMKTKTTEKK